MKLDYEADQNNSTPFAEIKISLNTVGSVTSDKEIERVAYIVDEVLIAVETFLEGLQQGSRDLTAWVSTD